VEERNAPENGIADAARSSGAMESPGSTGDAPEKYGSGETAQKPVPSAGTKQRGVETFLDCPPCPFRRTSFGATHCAISTDPYVSEVDPLTCFNCSVPKTISIPRCRFLSLGTEVRSYRGEGQLVVSMACKELNIRLYNFDTCAKCPLYSEVPSVASEMIAERSRADVSIALTEDVAKSIAGDIKTELRRRTLKERDDYRPSDFVRCFRFEEGYCRKFPEYIKGKVTCVLPENARNNELYSSAIRPALKELGLFAYRFKEPFSDVEFMCQACENQQESDYVVYNLEEWSGSALMLIGMAYGMGKQPVLLLRSGFPRPPLLAILEHAVVEYESISQLKYRLKVHFAPLAQELGEDVRRSIRLMEDGE